MIRIGFDAKRLFCNNTGLGNYSRSLVANLQLEYPNDEYVLFSPKLRRNSDTEPFFSEDFERIYPGKLAPFWRTKFIVNDIKKADLDIYHGLSHELPVGIDNADCKSIVTIHDLIYKFHPEDFSAIDRKIFDLKFKYSCKHADKIIAISNSTKLDLMMHYEVPEDKIRVLYQSCDDRFKRPTSTAKCEEVRKKYNLPKHFLLSVGSVITRKNILSAVKAMEQLKGIINLPLVIVGGGGAYLETVKAYIKQKGLEDVIIFPPYVSNEDLPALYQMTRIFIYPSRYEGFGIPLIESLWSKTPVITTRLSSLPEAAGDGAWYCDPDKPETIAEGIVRLCTSPDYYKTLMNDGFRHVQQFSTETTTRKLYTLYDELMHTS